MELNALVNILHSKLRLSAMKNSGLIIHQILWLIIFLIICKLWAIFDQDEHSTTLLGYINQTGHFLPYKLYPLYSFSGSSSWTIIMPSSSELDVMLFFSFSICTLFLGKLICFCYFQYHQYPDNPEMSVFNLDASSDVYAGTSSCQHDISAWLCSKPLCIFLSKSSPGKFLWGNFAHSLQLHRTKVC